MEARFIIRTAEGEELRPKSLEIFSDLVRSGVIRPSDLVFDALTGEWAPARSHPMVRLFQDPLTVDPTAPSLDRKVGELGLDLVEPEAPSLEEQEKAFIARMEEERRADPDVPSGSEDVPLVTTGSASVSRTVSAPEEPAPPVEPVRPAATPAPSPSGSVEPVSIPTAAPTPTVLHARPPRPVPARRFPWAWVAGIVVVGGIGVGATVLLSRGGDAEAGADAADAGTEQPRRTAPLTEEETWAVAYMGFIDGVAVLRDEVGVGEVPPIWLEGQYLADPDAYPEVREYWTRYEDYVEAARASETTLFRGAYLTAAADAGVSGPVRSLRLAAAQREFAARRQDREAEYQRAAGLARAALDLDDVLHRLKGRVNYEPISGPRVSADPVIEAAGADPEAQGQLEAALDEVLRALQGSGDGAPGDRRQVPNWLVDGLGRLRPNG